MPLETIWFTFEIEFFDADPLIDRIPADSEREARDTIRRVYPAARVVRLKNVERKENYFARFDPATANRKISLKPRKSAATPVAEPIVAPEPVVLAITCPACSRPLRPSRSAVPVEEACPGCGWRFEVRPVAPTHTVIAPLDKPEPSLSMLPELAKAPWFEVLETAPDATLREIRSAYLDLVRQYHPDKVSHLGKGLIAYAEARTAALNSALQAALRARR